MPGLGQEVCGAQFPYLSGQECMALASMALASMALASAEFCVRLSDDSLRPIAWMSKWSDSERRAMTGSNSTGRPRLNPDHLGRRAQIIGQEEESKSGRLRYARLEEVA